MSVTVHVKYNHFPRIARALPQRTSQVVRKTAADIRSRAQGSAPVRTGNLKGKIQVKGMAPGALSAIVHSAAEYSLYVDRGTRYMGARPFFTNAVESGQRQFEQAMQQMLRSLK